MRNRYLTVPKNDRGIEEYNSGSEHTENLMERVLEEVEFDTLCHERVFKQINDRCGLMIDDYESEIISSDNISKCIDIISAVPGSFYEMAKAAMQHNTMLCLDF